MNDQHFQQSSYREKLIEHLLVGELLKLSWRSGNCELEVAKPEVDNRGYDIILERGALVRHVQFKASFREARTARQNVHVSLAEKPSGCVVWVQFEADALDLGPFLYFGGPAGTRLPSLDTYPVAKHTKANSEGVKAERHALRVVPKRAFREVQNIADLYALLFDVAAFNQLVFEKARITLGTEAKARLWLSQSLPALGGASPVDVTMSPGGEKRVLRLLDQIEHGIYN